jgi:hypothetical protein
VNRFRLAHNIRLGTALLLVALEFTNLVPYLAEWGSKSTQFSRYPLQFAAYGLCLVVILLDRSNLKRLLERRIMLWASAFLLLLTWAMLVRMFNSPVGFSDYLLFREFGVQVNSIGFLLTCIVIFDDPDVLRITKQAATIATLAGAVLIVADVLYPPRIFSNISGRGAGLYVQPNSAGMAIVFGCLIGLKTIRRSWQKDLFALVCLVCVLATFSRQAALSFAVILLAGSLGRAFSPRRLILLGVVGVALFMANDLGNTLVDKNILTSDAWERLTLHWSDSSTMDRERLAYKTLEQFEDAPLIGQGFGTTAYWTDEPAHNSYLTFMADFGILGVLVIPGLVLSVRRNTWDTNAFTVIFLLWGLLSHLVLSELFALITIAILTVEPRYAERTYLDPRVAATAGIRYRTLKSRTPRKIARVVPSLIVGNVVGEDLKGRA